MVNTIKVVFPDVGMGIACNGLFTASMLILNHHSSHPEMKETLFPFLNALAGLD